LLRFTLNLRFYDVLLTTGGGIGHRESRTSMGQIRIEPGHLELFGGPHSQPFGEFRAVSASGQPLTQCSWQAGDRKVIVEPDAADASRVTVGSYQPVHTTVTVTASGSSATASLTVYVMDGGPPVGR
jgi:hypothetical protein